MPAAFPLVYCFLTCARNAPIGQLLQTGSPIGQLLKNSAAIGQLLEIKAFDWPKLPGSLSRASITEKNNRVRYLSDDECTALIEVSKTSRWDRLYLLILTAISTGARKPEMLNLKWQDIDFQNREATLQTRKNGEPGLLSLQEFLIDELKKFRGIDTVFPAHVDKSKPAHVDGHWRTALKKAGIPTSDFTISDIQQHRIWS